MFYQASGFAKPYEQDFGSGHQESVLADSWEPPERILRNYLERLKVFHFNDTTINTRIRTSSSSSDDSYLRSDGGNIASFLYRMRETPEELSYYKRIIQHVRSVFPQLYDFVLEPD